VLTFIADQSGAEGSLLTFAISATDPDGDTVTYGAANLPAGASFERRAPAPNGKGYPAPKIGQSEESPVIRPFWSICSVCPLKVTQYVVDPRLTNR